MTGVQIIRITAEEAGQRLDRWLLGKFPGIGHGRLQKWFRTGQVRVDGKRVKANARIEQDQDVRVPPFVIEAVPERKARPKPLDLALVEELMDRVLYEDKDILAIDKPAGLAVQGGSGTTRHLDGALDGLKRGATERPRLVHRLDKDTSGVLLLARNVAAARWLTARFRERETRKLYWALVAGVPKPKVGEIDLDIIKRAGSSGERVEVDEAVGKRALTSYRVLDHAGRTAAWLALEPHTGRTHQLRVHAAEGLNTPILGDGKYGGPKAFLEGFVNSKQMHLHARAVRLKKPDGRKIEIVAAPPKHFLETFERLGFDLENGRVLFSDD